MITSGSLPPPTIAPAVIPGMAPSPMGRIGPIAFRAARGPESGARNMVFIDDPEPAVVTVTGEFFPPAQLAAYRIGATVLTALGAFALLGALLIVAGDESQQTIALTLCFAGLAALVAQLVWRAVLVHGARTATLTARPVDLRGVRATVNWQLLGWWLVIGPFALVPLFAGRRLLRLELPVAVDGRVGMLRLKVREQRRGDAEMVVLRLRLAGAQ